MIVPHGLKRPGLTLVAPRKAAAKAGSRKVSPELRVRRRGGADVENAGRRAHRARADRSLPIEFGQPRSRSTAPRPVPGRRTIDAGPGPYS